jgi:hypothetical protein
MLQLGFLPAAERTLSLAIGLTLPARFSVTLARP